MYVEANLTFDQVISRIHIKEPIAITRFGDGELAFWGGRYHGKDIRETIINNRRVLNFDIPHLQSIVRTAWIMSDIVGVGHMRLFDVDQHILDNYKKQYMCRHDIIRHEQFGTRSAAAIWLKPFDKIAIIGQYAKQIQSRNFDEIVGKEILYITTDNPIDANHRNDIIDNALVKTKSCEIVLWGCGLPLKDLGILLSQNNQCVSIDMGSTLDAWANVPSRTAFKTDNKYLLL